MAVRLLGLNCSPRDNSNSAIMLETAFDKLDAVYPGAKIRQIKNPGYRAGYEQNSCPLPT